MTTSQPAGLVARPASDAALGAILLGAGVLALWDSRGASFESWELLDAAFFPATVGVLLIATAAILLLRARFRDPAPPMRWKLRDLVIVMVAIAVAAVTLVEGAEVLLQFGPPEIAMLIAFVLALAFALARLSRLRAAGMVSLGLLLSAIGLDAITGKLRLTMGLEELIDGIGPVVSLGVVVVADAAMCLVSPSLFLASYGRMVAGWRDREVPRLAAAGMRAVAAAVVAGACLYAYDLSARVWEIGEVVALGAFGVACKLLGWNRFVLVVGFAYGALLEENVRHTMLLGVGDPMIFLERPISATLAFLTCGVLAAAALASLRRARRRTQQHPG